MIAIDTNILVRYLVKDDKPQEFLATQFLRIRRLFQTAPAETQKDKR